MTDLINSDGIDLNKEISNQQVYFLVAQIDERTKSIKEIQAEIKKNTDENHNNLAEELRHGYVKNETFDPVKRIVYGLVSIILTGIGVAILGLVLRR